MICVEGVEDGTHKGAERVIKPFGLRIQIPMGVDEPVGICRFKRTQDDRGHDRTVPQADLPFKRVQDSTRAQTAPERAMSINTESDIEANLQIGPTDKGMVRIYVEAKGVEIPMDFDPEEANEIADEIKAAAKAAGALKK